MKLYVASQGEYDDSLILGIFSTLDAAKEACGDSANEWTDNSDGGSARQAEWGPEGLYQWPHAGSSAHPPTKARPLLRWHSYIEVFDLDVAKWDPRGSTDPWKS